MSHDDEGDAEAALPDRPAVRGTMVYGIDVHSGKWNARGWVAKTVIAAALAVTKHGASPTTTAMRTPMDAMLRFRGLPDEEDAMSSSSSSSSSSNDAKRVSRKKSLAESKQDKTKKRQAKRQAARAADASRHPALASVAESRSVVKSARRLCAVCLGVARYQCPTCVSASFGGYVCSVPCLATHRALRCGKRVV